MSIKWDHRFLDLARQISQWSKDPTTKVGAVIVDCQHRVVGIGYNGFPRGVDDSKERYEDRELKHRLTVHAELNAILNANTSVEDCTLYVWPTFYWGLSPACNECAKAIIQSGIGCLVGVNHGVREYDLMWRKSYVAAGIMLEEAGVLIEHVNF